MTMGCGLFIPRIWQVMLLIEEALMRDGRC
jgi:hypothetical protein